MTEIPVFRPWLGQEESAAALEALDMGWLGMGSYVAGFEAALAQMVQVPAGRVVAVSTGHAALHLALLSAGVGPGDEVITPAFNNIADFQAILATGAQPVFCDIDDRTLCIDVEKASDLVGERTKAIIAMDYDCLLCDHDSVAELAAAHGLRVVHDAAHSIGSTYHGRPVGSFGDMTMFSFDPVKTVTCIDGGALVVRTDDEAAVLREMRLIGMGQPVDVMYQNKRAWTYDVNRLGFRYHMANMHAAIGLAQLAKFDQISATRRAACLRYNERLGDLPGIRVPDADFVDVTPFLYYLRIQGGRRDAFRAALAAQGIDTGVHWQPGHWFTLFQSARRGDLSVTDAVAEEIVSLPLHSGMEPDVLGRVCQAVEAFAHER